MDDRLDINTPEPPPGPRRPHPGAGNVLISAERRWHSPHVHVLAGSVKFAIRGEIDVETRRGRYRVSRRRFLLVNAWEPYTFQIAPGDVAETCSLFFRGGYLASLQEAALGSHATLLERGPAEGARGQLEFPEALFEAGSSGVGPSLRQLHSAWRAGASQLCLADRVRDVGEALIRLRTGAHARAERIAAVRASTRAELFRRTQAAAMFAREHFAGDIGLGRAARHAGMAPHHLHRTFRAVHGLTLHQWIVQLRLEEARRLLAHSDLPVAAVCRRVGYTSAPSFANLFRARFGCSPTRFRRQSAVHGGAAGARLR